jgi:SPP1 family predicted phage head-tail adaptor
MLRAGALNERVEILSSEMTRGELGEQVITYNRKVTVWASVKFQKGIEAITLGESWMTRQVLIMMRNNNVVNERCRLRWDGKTYGIESLNRSKIDGSVTIIASVLDESDGTG